MGDTSFETPSARGPAKAPAGFVARDEAARLLGIAAGTFKGWCRDGRVPGGCVVGKDGGGWCKVYPLSVILQLREQVEAERGRLPDGMVDLEAARTRFGISRTTWKRWQREKRVPVGRWVQRVGVRTRVKAYTVEELDQLEAMFQRVGQPYADPERAGVWRVPVMSFRTTVCEALIDEADLPRVAGRRWNWCERGDEYAGCVKAADRDDDERLKYVVLGLTTEGRSIAHANGDPLDCRRENLVVRTLSEKNGSARKCRSYRGQPTTSRFKGVSWVAKRGLWHVSIKKGEKPRYLGRYKDEIAAAQAYDEAARELFGEHARLNFPDGVDAWLEKHAAEEKASEVESAPAALAA